MYGWVKGQPLEYLKGHNASGPGLEYRIDPDTGCWIWLRARYTTGYGRAWVDGRRRPAHRVVFERYCGVIGDGLELDHLCETPLCVNPSHLEPVTHAENIRRCRRTRLTVAIAAEIRASDAPASVLAERFGVAIETIRSVRNGVSWVAV